MAKPRLFVTVAVLALALLSLPLAAAFSSPIPGSEGSVYKASAATAVDIMGVPSGWNTGWVSQNVTLTITAKSATGTVVAGWTLWDPTGPALPPPLRVASTASTTVVVTQEATTAVIGAAVRPDGSINSSASAYIRIDKTKPMLGYRFGAPFSSSWTSMTAVPVTLVATESLSGLRGGVRYRYQRNGVSSAVETTSAGSTIVLMGEGRYAIEASATDVAGNVSPSTWTTFGVDATPPKTTFSHSSFIGRADIELLATDALSGVKSTYYQMDEGEVQSGRSIVVTLPANAVQPVEHRLRFWSVDLAGNIETATPSSREVTFTIAPDREAPSTTLKELGTGPADSWFPGEAMLTLVATDPAPASGVARTFYRVDGGSVTTYTAPFKVSGTSSATVEYWSVDRSGISEQAKTSVIRFDTTRPWSIPDVRTIFTSVATVWITAFDGPSGVASVEAWIDNGAPQVVAVGQSGVSTLTASASCNLAGEHRLHYTTVDFAGNREETRTVVVHVRRNTAFSMSTKSGSLTNTSLPAKATISGRLLDGSFPVKGRRVYIEYSTTSTFSRSSSASTVTDSKGAFAFNTSLSAKTYYRMRYGGDIDYAASSSSSIRLLPRAYMSTPAAKTTQRAGRTFAVSGTIKPGHTSSSTLRIKKYLLVGGKPVYKGYTKATVTSKGTYSTYKAYMKLSRGSWRLYAYMPEDAGHASTTTPKYLSVKVSP